MLARALGRIKIDGERKMSLVGKTIRLRRIFRDDGKTFVVTMDHGVDLGPVRGLEDFGATLKNVLGAKCQADAVLMNPSNIRRYYQEICGKAGIVARLDGATTIVGPDITDYRLFSSVEDALRAGSDAVCTMAFIGVEREAQNLEKIGKVAQECEKWGMPQIVEALPPGIVDYYFKPEAERQWPNPEHICFAARSAAELGADVVKTYYTGDPETFKEVVRCCPAPIIVASGPGADDPKGLLRMVKEVMGAGAKGVIMGRNVWGYKDLEAMMYAIKGIVHQNAALEDALKLIR